MPNPPKSPISRRGFGKFVASLLSGFSAFVTACTQRMPGPPQKPGPASIANETFCPATDDDEFDFVVVGSGAGGGPLAANLARAGYRVCILEAGGAQQPYNSKVPAFHPFATEDVRLRWDFYVRHYENDEQQRRDPKFVTGRDGVLYPRAGTLGGCTAHHAMIAVYPHNSDWDHIAEITNDPTWRSSAMRDYFERLECCEYVERPDDPNDPTQNPGRHGFDGWLVTEAADPNLLVQDRKLTSLVKAAAFETFARLGKPLSRLKKRLVAHLDPNDWRLVEDGSEGGAIVPMSTNFGRRSGPREYIERVQKECPHHLVVKTHALVSRVVLDDDNRATGVEYLEGPSLYRADPRSSSSVGLPQTKTLSCRREVILSGGTFNTPQILMLSGIGPPEELAKHDIPVRIPLEGVGKNLQDRYEVGVISEMNEDFESLRDAPLEAPGIGEQPDPAFEQWLNGQGVYTSNGAVFSIIKRSGDDVPDPDLFLFGLAGSFEGYFPGYSNRFRESKNFFTWAVLKGHTTNTAGRVTLRSADPRDVPEIQFRYFDEGSAGHERDLDAVVEGVRYVRCINKRSAGLIRKEVVPGPDVESAQEIRQFIKDNAWGHHACGTCRIGDREDGAVLSSDFRVHGTHGLRVVDASVFPKIPGFFIVVPIYMVSEKATDVIIADARRRM